MSNLCEKCGADKDVWREMLGEEHTCEYSSQHLKQQRGDSEEEITQNAN